jgi:hypothetical protein
MGNPLLLSVFARASFVALLALPLASSSARAQTVVTTCGQEVAGPAALNADLDCTGVDDYAVQVHRGTLTLNGHTITGGFGVFCDGPCKVVGPGTVRNSVHFGVNGMNTVLKVSQVDLTDNAIYGAQCFGTCKIDGPATISGSGVGIRNGGTLTGRNLTITGNQQAVEGGNNEGTTRVLLRDSSVTGNGSGVTSHGGVKLIHTTVTGNGKSGVTAGQAVFSRPEGVHCERKSLATLFGSTVTGNGTDPACGVTTVCWDVATCLQAPRLHDSTCEHSYAIASGNPGTDWDVCTLD